MTIHLSKKKDAFYIEERNLQLIYQMPKMMTRSKFALKASGLSSRKSIRHRGMNEKGLGRDDCSPLHISPVDRAGSVSEISPRHSFLYKNFDVFI